MNFIKKIIGYFFKSREERLFKAINKGDEKAVDSLIRGKDCDSKRYNFLNLAVIYGNENIVTTLLEKGGFDINDVNKDTGDSVLHLAVSKKNHNLVKFFVDRGIDVTIKNSQGVSALCESIHYGSDDISKLIIESRNYDELDKAGDLLYECAAKSRYETAKLLLTKGFDLDKKIRGDLTARELFALNNDAKDFLRETGSFSADSDLDNFITASRAKAILNLSYSEDEIGMRPSLVNKLIKSSIVDKEFEKKDIILQTLDEIGDGSKKIMLPNGNSLSIRGVSYEDHAAYLIFENDGAGNPLKVTYCDGNSIGGADKNGYINGAVSFNIDQNKMAKFAGADIWEHYLEDAFRGHSKEMYKDNGKNFYDAISKIAVCDESGKPVSEEQIPTKAQKRGNCTLKSTDIVIREVLRRSDPEMVFEHVDGKQSGKGYETYKAYKNLLTEEPINKLIDLADKSHESDFGYKGILDILKNMIFPKAQKKGNQGLIEKLNKAFYGEEEKNKGAIPEQKIIPSPDVFPIEASAMFDRQHKQSVEAA
ncbi:MAG: ankyrin repeat domain-containing protein [Rickettsiales bacterium]|nr:ankyrin repeat domain-containing protein [Rickettsiales bacterium]